MSRLGLAIAAVMVQALADSNRQVGAFKLEPELDTRKGPEQLTYQDKLRLQAEAHQDRIARAEEKRRRRIERNKRQGGN